MPTTMTNRVLSLLAVLLLGTLVLASGVRAQSTQGEPVDLVFRVDNVTTGEPGTLERLVISYIVIMPEVIIDVRPTGSEFELADVPVKPDGRYIVTAWADGVPYFFARKGRVLVDGPQVLQVFSTTRSLDEVAVSGLNIVARREAELLHLEYLFQVRNDQRPQLTIYDPRATFTLFLPGSAHQVTAEFHRGPTPTTVPVTHAGGHKWELGVPLVSGNNRLRLTAVIPWQENLELPVGANLPVEAWSLLVTPDWLEVNGRGLESDRDSRSVKRMIGPRLNAGRILSVRLSSGEKQGGAVSNIFSDTVVDTATIDQAAATGTDEGRGLPLPLMLLGLVVGIVVVVALVRRRS